MSTTTTDTDVEITLSASAIDAHREALELIRKARLWSEGHGLTWDEIKDGKGEIIVAQRREKVRAMELSYFTNLAHVLTMTQGWDGPLKVFRDTEASFYWRHQPRIEGRRGMEGGLVFIRDSSLSNPGDPLTIGEWSVHT